MIASGTISSYVANLIQCHVYAFGVCGKATHGMDYGQNAAAAYISQLILEWWQVQAEKVSRLAGCSRFIVGQKYWRKPTTDTIDNIRLTALPMLTNVLLHTIISLVYSCESIIDSNGAMCMAAAMYSTYHWSNLPFHLFWSPLTDSSGQSMLIYHHYLT